MSRLKVSHLVLAAIFFSCVVFAGLAALAIRDELNQKWTADEVARADQIIAELSKRDSFGAFVHFQALQYDEVGRSVPLPGKEHIYLMDGFVGQPGIAWVTFRNPLGKEWSVFYYDLNRRDARVLFAQRILKVTKRGSPDYRQVAVVFDEQGN